jgi:hypothetical protein
MKASKHFLETLETGFLLIAEEYGVEKARAASDWTLFWAVSDSVSPGHRHNAKVTMPLNERFHEETKSLNDSHIATAIKAARKKVNLQTQ